MPLIGYVERRVTPRAPSAAALAIRFERDGREVAQGSATDLSESDIGFYIPLGSLNLEPGVMVVFVFVLPDQSEVGILGEIRHAQWSVDLDMKRIVRYKAKFANMSQEAWTKVRELAVKQAPGVERSKAPPPAGRVFKERMDVRVKAGYGARLAAAGKVVDGIVEDLSYGGARVFLKGPAKPGDKVDLTIIPGSAGKDITLDGVCLWSRPVPGGRGETMAGIRFNHLNAEEFEGLRLLIFASAGLET